MHRNRAGELDPAVIGRYTFRKRSGTMRFLVLRAPAWPRALIQERLALHMRPVTRTVQRFLPSRRERVAGHPLPDALNEFAPEPDAIQARAVTMVVAAPVKQMAPERRPLKPAARVRVVIRIPAGLWRQTAAVGSAVVVVAAVLGTSLVALREKANEPRMFIAPAPSPIEVQYPDYPGAPPLLAAASIAVPAPIKATLEVEEPAAPRLQRRRPVGSRVVAALAAESGPEFGVRGPAPQAASIVPAVAALPVADRAFAADSPPRRIGPPIAVTTLGGAAAQNGRVVLVLEITEQGDVARIVSLEAVDVHADVTDTVAAAARGWRYEPARRDGVPVPARVRVVVQLSGGN